MLLAPSFSDIMSQQGQADQIQELTTSDTPRTADRDRIDRTVEVQEMLRTSSPPSGTIERMYREPQSHTMNKTVSETRLLWITILYIKAVAASI